MMAALRFGAKVDNYGPAMARLGLAQPAARAEAAGFSSLWLSDHVVMPPQTRSTFPFSDDGLIYWDPRDPWYEPVVCLPVLAAATTKAEIGVGVLLAALRQPIVLAKQLASIDAMSHGRLLLGVGAGWMEEEFEILGTDFHSRGERLGEWLTLLRQCWTGTPEPFEGKHYSLPGTSSATRRQPGGCPSSWAACRCPRYAAHRSPATAGSPCPSRPTTWLPSSATR